MKILLNIILTSLVFTTVDSQEKIDQLKGKIMKVNKMRVDIWSDVMCPFCYIGKRQFETALSSFPDQESVEVVWHSFQIQPSLTQQPNKDFYTYVAERKGQDREWSVKVHESIIAKAKSIGLEYRLDKAKITNSFDAHRVIQYAKKYHLTNELEERFFKAYFTEGALMDDHSTLVSLAKEVGLDEQEVKRVLSSKEYADDVQKDGEIVKNFGATGVPFFIIDNKYAVSGAQSPEVYKEVLTRAYSEWKTDKADTIEVINGESCSTDGICK